MVPDNFHEREIFTNTNQLYLFNKEIIEYDMENAGYNLVRNFELLPPEEISFLSSLGKKDRTIQLGKMQLKYPELKTTLKFAFQTARKYFYKYNDLELEDIVSVKKDAIITTKRCEHQKFDKYINFRPKHQYSSYVILSKAKRQIFEFYYSPTELDVKGISEEKLKLHEGYMLDFLKKWFFKMETQTQAEVLAFTTRFIDKYKRKELDVGYYRRFNAKSDYVLKGQDPPVTFLNFDENWKDTLDISYNYFQILIKLAKIPL